MDDCFPTLTPTKSFVHNKKMHEHQVNMDVNLWIHNLQFGADENV